MPTAVKVWQPAEVAKHNTAADCWTIIHGRVYNLTSFLNEHPGGSAIILKYAGRDATKAFDPIHPPDIIEKLLPPSVCLGVVEGQQQDASSTAPPAKTTMNSAMDAVVKPRPDLGAILNLSDFEAVARDVMRPDGWAYYSSAADDEITVRENRLAFHRIWLKPRVMRNVRVVHTATTMLGHPMSMPIYITATALGKLGHPEGEVVLTRAAHTGGLIQMVPTLSSCSLQEITAARQPDQVQFFQLYVNQNREITESLIRRAEEAGCRALFVTVDAPTLAKREKDMRMKFVNRPPDVQVQHRHSINRSVGAARAIGSFIDAGLCWDDIKWFRGLTSMPIVLKGVQCAEDAALAVEHGLDGIVLSNHGGRQLDFSRSAIEVLPEVMQTLKRMNATDKLEVYVDGGVRRGTDIFKALALGARAVGIGRPFLYAMSAYGQEGVEHAINILRDEFEMTMRLMGVTRLEDIRPEMLCSASLDSHGSAVPKDYLAHATYDRMIPPRSRL